MGQVLPISPGKPPQADSNAKGEALTPAELDAMLLLARQMLQHGHHESSRALLEVLGVLLPDDETVHRCLALTYLQSGAFEQALSQIEALEQIVPANDFSDEEGLTGARPELELMRSAVLSALGRIEQAREAYAKYSKFRHLMRGGDCAAIVTSTCGRATSGDPT